MVIGVSLLEMAYLLQLAKLLPHTSLLNTIVGLYFVGVWRKFCSRRGIESVRLALNRFLMLCTFILLICLPYRMKYFAHPINTCSHK